MIGNDEREQAIESLSQDVIEERDNLRWLLRRHDRRHPECIASAKFIRLRHRMVTRMMRELYDDE